MQIDVIEISTGNVVRTIDQEGKRLDQVEHLDYAFNKDLDNSEFYTQILNFTKSDYYPPEGIGK